MIDNAHHPHVQRLQAHLQRVSGLAHRLGFVGPPGTTMLDFLDDRFDRLESDGLAARLLLQAAGTLQDRSNGRKNAPEALDLHTGLRLIDEAHARLAAQRTTIEVLVAQRTGPIIDGAMT